MNFEALLFWIMAALVGLCGLATVISQNIVRAATWLLFTLAGTSGIFFLLGADLVGAIQLLVYVGGTLILVVFGVMLTAQGPFVNMKASGAEWAISVAAGALLLAILVIGLLPLQHGPLGPADPKEPVVAFAPKGRLGDNPGNSPYSMVIGQGFLGVGVGPAHNEQKVGKPRVIRTHYLLPFEIVSVHLLVVLIGAAYLARAKRRREVLA